jgi:hypothetical protein
VSVYLSSELILIDTQAVHRPGVLEGYQLESTGEGFRPAREGLEGDGLEQRVKIS